MEIITTLEVAPWQDWEARLDGHGHAVPLTARHSYAHTQLDEAFLVKLSGPAGRESGCVAHTTRRVSGHRVLRVDRFGSTIAEGDEVAMARALVEVMRDARNLRLDLRLFHPDPARRAALSAALEHAGFARAAGGDYRRTLRIDLERPLDDVLASFSSSARRNVRSLDKSAMEIRPLGPEHAARVGQLYEETMSRTGGVVVHRDWPATIAYASAHPRLLHAVGGFLPDEDGNTELIAFACSRMHGDHAEYAEAASTRVGSSRVKPGHVLMWDAVSWAHGQAAAWLDMGGVTAGTAEDPDDPLGGISDFKRSFSRDELEIAEEWVLHSRTVRARAARLVQRALSRYR